MKDALLNEIVDNPDITRQCARSFTIKSSALSSDFVLSPRYYDFLTQRDCLIGLVENKPIEQWSKVFHTIVDTGRYNSERFHPKVIDNLKKIMQEYNL